MAATDGGRPPFAAAYDLAPHPEGGWYRETWRSDVVVEPDGYDGPRTAATAILFALHPGESSAWHAVRSAEVWLWHQGGPLLLRLGGVGSRPSLGTSVVETLGPDVGSGQHLQTVVAPGVWQSAEPAGDEAVLVSCVVAPGFDFADFRLADPPPPGPRS
jgi:predicted cupin superfamily sugar epimerase